MGLGNEILIWIQLISIIIIGGILWVLMFKLYHKMFNVIYWGDGFIGEIFFITVIAFVIAFGIVALLSSVIVFVFKLLLVLIVLGITITVAVYSFKYVDGSFGKVPAIIVAVIVMCLGGFLTVKTYKVMFSENQKAVVSKSNDNNIAIQDKSSENTSNSNENNITANNDNTQHQHSNNENNKDMNQNTTQSETSNSTNNNKGNVPQNSNTKENNNNSQNSSNTNNSNSNNSNSNNSNSNNSNSNNSNSNNSNSNNSSNSNATVNNNNGNNENDSPSHVGLGALGQYSSANGTIAGNIGVNINLDGFNQTKAFMEGSEHYVNYPNQLYNLMIYYNGGNNYTIDESYNGESTGQYNVSLNGSTLTGTFTNLSTGKVSNVNLQLS